MVKNEPTPLCIIIAGPNGAGKTTFAKDYLAKETRVVHFVNADLVAGGLSPLRPELAAVSAGRLFLRQIDQLAKARANFSFETTLSGLTYVHRIQQWKAAGYRIEIVFLKIASPALAMDRVASRVRQGGHDIPDKDLLRRYTRSWEYFEQIYRSLADKWLVYDNSGSAPRLMERSQRSK
jgi:predicted ABC-type ATPase